MHGHPTELTFDYPKREYTLEDEALVRKQLSFANLIGSQPALAENCRTLQWTRLQPGPREHQCDPLTCAEDQLWRTFNSFTKLTAIDLAFTTTWREEDRPPASLFSTVTSAALGGIMSHAVVSCIFSSLEPSRLRHLTINNLQTFADGPLILGQHAQEEILLHRRDRPGPLQGYLQAFTGKCIKLQTFQYLMTGTLLDESYRHTSTWPQDVRDERSRYAELAAFIASVKPHIQELRFEHGPDVYDFDHAGRIARDPRLLNIDVPLPMDTYFDAHLLPVLASAEWLKLTKLEVRGIGHWKTKLAWNEGASAEEIRYLHGKTLEFANRAQLIWEAVHGDGVDVCIEDSASRPFYRYQADRTSNGSGTTHRF